jgi:hypothetical protein
MLSLEKKETFTVTSGGGASGVPGSRESGDRSKGMEGKGIALSLTPSRHGPVAGKGNDVADSSTARPAAIPGPETAYCWDSWKLLPQMSTVDRQLTTSEPIQGNSDKIEATRDGLRS